MGSVRVALAALVLTGFVPALSPLPQDPPPTPWSSFPLETRSVFSVEKSEGEERTTWTETVTIKGVGNRKYPVSISSKESSVEMASVGLDRPLGEELVKFDEEGREKVELKVAGKNVTCTRSVFTSGSKRVTVWASRDMDVPERQGLWGVCIPAPVFKVESLQISGERRDLYRSEILDTRAKLMAADREFTCIREQVTIERTGAGKGDIKQQTIRWLNREVPGHVVREELTRERARGPKIRIIRHLTELPGPK